MNYKHKYYGSLILFFIGFSILGIALILTNYIPFKQKLLILSVLTMASMALLIVTKASFWRGFAGVLLILVSLYFVSSQKDLEEITQNTQYEIVEYNLLILDSAEATMDKVGVFGVRPEHHENLIDNFSSTTEFISYENLELLAQALEEQQIVSFLINDNLMPTLSVALELQGFNFKQEESYSIQVDNKTQAKQVDLFKDSYLIYVSGIDVEGNVLTRSQNEMNFVLAVNPKTNTILSISIPKDSYLRLGCGEEQMDAMKNAGFYGIDCSMKTLENYLSLEFNYYLRINLAGLEPLVDALDGVSVYSDLDIEGTDIQKGYNQVNGRQALESIRTEELQLDVVNEENPQHRYLFESILNKMLNEKNIYSLPQHVSLLKDVLDTNFSNRDLSKIISNQISKKHHWTIENLNLRGYSDYQMLYSDQSGLEHFIYWPGDGSKRDILEALDKVIKDDGK